jgi:hypothetical protein
MAIFSVTLQDSAGNAQTGKTVQLYKGDGVGTDLVGAMTDADNDGTYIYDLTESGIYTVKVNSAIITELQEIFIPCEDILDHIADESSTNPHSGSASTDDLNAIKGTGWTNETVKDNADAINEVKGTGWTNETVKDNADAINAVKGTGWTSIMTLKGHNDLIGDLDFEASVYLKHITNITNALRELDKQVRNIVVSGVSQLYEIRHIYSNSQVAAVTAGSQASAMHEWVETATSYKVKIRTHLFVFGNENNLKMICEAKADRPSEGYVKLSIRNKDTGVEEYNEEREIRDESYQSMSFSISLSELYGPKLITVEIKANSGRTGYLRNVEIYVE